MTTLSVLRPLCAQFAAFQALLLAAAALHKIVRWRYTRSIVRRFAGVPPPLAAPALGGAIASELAAAACLMIPAYRTIGAMLAASLWGVYLALMVRATGQARDLDCGCSFGSGFGTTAHPVGSFHILRNAVLASLALFVARVSTMSGSIAVQGSQGLAAFALLALYGALDQAMGLRPMRGGVVL